MASFQDASRPCGHQTERLRKYLICCPKNQAKLEYSLQCLLLSVLFRLNYHNMFYMEDITLKATCIEWNSPPLVLEVKILSFLP